MKPQDEIRAIWRNLQTQAKEVGKEGIVERTDVPALIRAAEAQADADRDLLEPWLSIVDLAIEFLYSLHQAAMANISSTVPPSFALLVGRACGFAVAIRRLVLTGLDESANVVLRSFFENLDIAIVALDDPKFAADFAKGEEQKRFWNKNIARGEVQRRAEDAIKRSGTPEVVLHDRRKRDWAILSSSTHSSFISAFRGAAVVSLASGGLFPSPLGYLGALAPIILSRVASETNDFATVVLRLAMTVDPPQALNKQATDEPLMRHVAGAYFTLQEMIKRHGGEINGYSSKLTSKS